MLHCYLDMAKLERPTSAVLFKKLCGLRASAAGMLRKTEPQDRFTDLRCF